MLHQRHAGGGRDVSSPTATVLRMEAGIEYIGALVFRRTPLSPRHYCLPAAAQMMPPIAARDSKSLAFI